MSGVQSYAKFVGFSWLAWQCQACLAVSKSILTYVINDHKCLGLVNAGGILVCSGIVWICLDWVV